MMLTIQPASIPHLPGMAQVHHEAFSRQTMSEEWIACNFQAFPRIRQFVALVEGEVIGYIQWVEKSGFRKEIERTR